MTISQEKLPNKQTNTKESTAHLLSFEWPDSTVKSKIKNKTNGLALGVTKLTNVSPNSLNSNCVDIEGAILSKRL